MGPQWDPRGPQEVCDLTAQVLEKQQQLARRLEALRRAPPAGTVGPLVTQGLRDWFRDETREHHYIVTFSIIQTMKNQYIDLLNHLFYNKNNEKSID